MRVNRRINLAFPPCIFIDQGLQFLRNLDVRKRTR